MNSFNSQDFIITKDNVNKLIKKHKTSSASWFISKKFHTKKKMIKNDHETKR